MSFNKKHLIFGGILILSLAVASFAFAQTTVNKDFDYTNTNYIYNLQGLSIGTSTTNNNAITFSDGTTFDQTNASASWTTDSTGIHYNSGNVGIGVTDPNSKLDVNGAIYGSIFYDKDNASYYINPTGTSNLGGLINFGSGWSNSGGTQMGSDTSPSKGIEFDFDTDRWFLYGREDSGSSETNELVLRIADNSSDSFLIEGESGSTVSNIASFARNPGIDFYQIIDANSNKIINLATPTSDSDAANKSYVDSSISGGTTSNAERCDADGVCEITKIDLGSAWDSTNITGNSFYSHNSTDGFAMGHGTAVSTWFSWDDTNGLNRAIDVYNNGNRVILGADGANVGIGDTTPSAKLDVNGNIYGSTFYDKDNTSYYINPSGNSAFSGNIGVGNTSPQSKVDVELGSSGEALRLLGSNLDVDFHLGHNGTDYGFFWRYKGVDGGNNNDLELWSQNQTGSNKQVYNIKQDGNITFYQNTYSPIVYDQNNTNYYSNPSGNSNINTMDFNRIDGPSSSDYDKIRVYDSSQYTIGMHDNMSLGWLNDWATTFTMNNDGNRGWVWRDTGHGTGGGAMSLDTDGNLHVVGMVRAMNDMRAPIYYDQNNTSYYANPSGTSNFNKINASSGNVFDNEYHNGGTQITIDGDANTYYPVEFKNDGVNQTFVKTLQIYRNYNETAPDTWNTSTHHGALVFKSTLNFGGWGGSGYDFRVDDFREKYANILYDAEITNSNMSFVVWLRGGTAVYHISGNWGKASSPNIYYSQTTLSNGSTVVSPKTGTPTLTNVNNRNFFRNGSLHSNGNSSFDGTLEMNNNNITNVNNIYANTFYDDNNTSYYANPASKSNFNTLTLPGNRIGFINSSFDAEIRVNDQNPYSTGAEFHFWGDGVEDHATLYADTYYAQDNMRAPIFYDSNNSSYYVNPSSNSKFAGNIDLPSGSGRIGNISSGPNIEFEGGKMEFEQANTYCFGNGNSSCDSAGGHLSTLGNLNMNGNNINDVDRIYASGDYIDFRPDDNAHGFIMREYDGSGTAWSGIRTTGSGEMQLRADGASYSQLQLKDNGNVAIGGGSGKLDVGTVDPIYTIGDHQYSTYMAGMTGVKEETTGSVNLTKDKQDYTHTIDFQELEKGSDLWVFYQTSDFGKNWNNLSVLLTGNIDAGNLTYEEIPSEDKLIIHGQGEGKVSYRLTAPRFDHDKWDNNYEGESEGLIVPEVK